MQKVSGGYKYSNSRNANREKKKEESKHIYATTVLPALPNSEYGLRGIGVTVGDVLDFDEKLPKKDFGRERVLCARGVAAGEREIERRELAPID